MNAYKKKSEQPGIGKKLFRLWTFTIPPIALVISFFYTSSVAIIFQSVGLTGKARQIFLFSALTAFFLTILGSLVLMIRKPDRRRYGPILSIFILILLLPLFRIPDQHRKPAFLDTFSHLSGSSPIQGSNVSDYRVRLGRDSRECAVISLNHSLEGKFPAVGDTRLEFSVGVSRDPEEDPYRVLAWLDSGPGRVDLFNEQIKGGGDRWEDFSASIPRSMADGRHTLGIAVTGSGGQNVYISGIRFLKNEEASSRPNILVIAIEATRADQVGFYGYSSRPTTPFLDSYAREQGIIFNNGYSASSFTTASVASILTGLYPDRHGAISFYNSILHPDLVTMAEVFSIHGYRTVGFSSNAIAGTDFNINQGFRSFFDYYENICFFDGDMEVALAAARELTRTSSDPFMCYIHFSNPHWPYAMPPFMHSKNPDMQRRLFIENHAHSMIMNFFQIQFLQSPRNQNNFQDNSIIRAYDGEIKRTDAAIQELFARLKQAGILTNTLVFITADHGEEFKDHGNVGHGKSVYQEVIHVPFILAGGVIPRRGLVSDCPVSHVDIMPTALEAAGIEIPDDLDGVSLWPFLGNNTCADRSIVSIMDCRVVGKGLWVTALQGPNKLISLEKEGQKTFELFDVHADPHETTDLSSQRPEIFNRLKQAIENHDKIKVTGEIGKNQIEILKALGYLN